MSQTFSFPPPPPPPPSRRDNPPEANVRGPLRGRGQPRGGHVRGQSASYSSSSRGHSSRGRGRYNHNNSSQTRGNLYNRGHNTTSKRNHTEAFGNHSQNRPKAPPAVPSFDIDIKSLLPPKPVAAISQPSKRKNNVLGLTPAAQDAESASEDDEDDELKLAVNLLSEGLTFEHGGEKLSLRTSAEIAAWIAERRKKFPTQAKAEAARKVAEEEKREWEEGKKARQEAYVLRKEAQEQERSQREREKIKERLLAAQVAKGKLAVAENKQDKALQARQKVERLKRRAEKAIKDLQRVEKAIEQSEQRDANFDVQNIDGKGEIHDPVVSVEGADSLSGSNDTSSSGSSASETDSDGDAEPEETSSKRDAPEHVPPSKPTAPKPDTDTICKFFLATGRCKFKDKCRYLHQHRERHSKNSSTTTRRKGLYQVMVEKEQEEELKRAVRAIIVLGEEGLLRGENDQSAVLKPPTASTAEVDSISTKTL